MAYNMEDRFSRLPRYYKLLDPGSYQYSNVSRLKSNKAPFLSNTPRNTQCFNKLYTDAIYYVDFPPKIPNCTSLMSKCPRFPYESFSKEDLEKILCQCGIDNYCECPLEEDNQKEEFVCQANVPRRLFKGPPPHSVLSEGDGSIKRLKNEKLDHSPPFYDANINELTKFYQGCKWSKWTSKRSIKSLEVRPGPADYYIEKEPTYDKICAEKVRSYRRKTSKQLRFIERVQRINLLENRPGPATYSPVLPKGTDLNFLGSKTERFPVPKYDKRPSPTHYWLKRDFDPVNPPAHPCHAKLPEAACFGIKAPRFRSRVEDGPSPASYCSIYKPCQFLQCSKAPFGSSALRFKEKINTTISDDELFVEEESNKNEKPIEENCKTPTWEFKSKTKRIKPLVKKLNEPSPADFPQINIEIQRLLELQYLAPFFSSEGRFRPWYDWLPVYGTVKTPGPCYYNLEKSECVPAVCCGPTFRSPRFPSNVHQTPAPNAYHVKGGIDTVLTTHNQRLKNNIQNKHKFNWQPPVDQQKLNSEERFNLLLQKSIQLLNDNEEPSEECVKEENIESNRGEKSDKPKLLRCFLYSREVPQCI